MATGLLDLNPEVLQSGQRAVGASWQGPSWGWGLLSSPHCSVLRPRAPVPELLQTAPEGFLRPPCV